MDKLVKEIGEAADAIINFKKHSKKLRSLLSTYQQLKEKQDLPSSDDISKSKMVELMEEKGNIRGISANSKHLIQIMNS